MHCQVAGRATPSGLDGGGAACVDAAAPGVVCGVALAGLERVGPLFEVEAHVGCSQGLHTATLGVVRRLNLVFGSLNTVQYSAVNRQGEPNLFELLFTGLTAGFSGVGDVDFLSANVNVTRRGEYV